MSKPHNKAPAIIISLPIQSLWQTINGNVVNSALLFHTREQRHRVKVDVTSKHVHITYVHMLAQKVVSNYKSYNDDTE